MLCLRPLPPNPSPLNVAMGQASPEGLQLSGHLQSSYLNLVGKRPKQSYDPEWKSMSSVERPEDWEKILGAELGRLDPNRIRIESGRTHS